MQTSSPPRRYSRRLCYILWQVFVLGKTEFAKSKLEGLSDNDLEFLDRLFADGAIAVYRDSAQGRYRLMPKNMHHFLTDKKYEGSDVIKLKISSQRLLEESIRFGLIGKKKHSNGYWYWHIGDFVIDPSRLPKLYILDSDTARTLFMVYGMEKFYDVAKPMLAKLRIYNITDNTLEEVYEESENIGDATVSVFLFVRGGGPLLGASARRGDANAIVYLNKSVDIEQAKTNALMLLEVADGYSALLDYAVDVAGNALGKPRAHVFTKYTYAVAIDSTLKSIDARLMASFTISQNEELVVEVSLSRDRLSPNKENYSYAEVEYRLDLGETANSLYDYLEIAGDKINEKLGGFAEFSALSNISFYVKVPIPSGGIPYLGGLCRKILMLKEGVLLQFIDEFIRTITARPIDDNIDDWLKYKRIIESIKWDEKKTEDEKLFALLAMRIAYGGSDLFSIMKKLMVAVLGKKAEKYLSNPTATIRRLLRKGILKIMYDDMGRPRIYAYGKKLEDMFSPDLAKKVSLTVSGVASLYGYGRRPSRALVHGNAASG